LQRVEMRRLHIRITGEAESLRTSLVGDDEQDVGLIRRDRPGGDDGESDK
jgi:hypothetical protein